MKQFLASVGTAKLFGKKNGKLVHVADVRTLTESTLNFSTQTEEVRAGQGATLIGRFAHSSTLEITLTDVMWDLSYLSLITGGYSDSFFGGNNGFYSETLNNAGPTIELSRTPTTMGASCGLDRIIVWIKEAGCDGDDESVAVEIVNGTSIINTPRKFVGKTVCLQYFVNVPQARAIKIPANFVPAELLLILTTKLFAGDADSPELGKAIGEITFKIPRFSLNGELELAMQMNSVANTSLKGVALSSGAGGCTDTGIYAEIVQVYYGSTAGTGLVDLFIDPDSIEVGGIPIVWGKYKDGIVAEIPFDDCIYSPAIDPEIGLVKGTVYTLTVGKISETFSVGFDYEGNPLIFQSNTSAIGDNPLYPIASVVLYDEDAPDNENKINVDGKNISIIGGDTSVNIISNDDSSYEIFGSSDEPTTLNAGSLSVIISGES